MKRIAVIGAVSLAILITSCGERNDNAGDKSEQGTDMLGDTMLRDTPAIANDTIGIHTTDSARQSR